MSDLAERAEVRNWTEEEKQAAAQTKVELNKVLDEIQASQKKLEIDFVKLGTMVHTVRDRKFWIIWNFKSFGAFVESIEPKVGKGRTQIFAAANIAEQLLPAMTEEELVQTGISKASKLASAVKKAQGKKPSDELIAQAKDNNVTIAEFDSKIASEYEFVSDYEDGTWLDLSGVFLSKEEKDEFYRAVRVACQTDPPLERVLTQWNDNHAAHIRKEVLTRWYRDFLATYETEFNRKEKV